MTTEKKKDKCLDLTQQFAEDLAKVLRLLSLVERGLREETSLTEVALDIGEIKGIMSRYYDLG